MTPVQGWPDCVVGYVTEEKDWSAGLNDAKDLKSLRDFVIGWMPYVQDALDVVHSMGEPDFLAWRLGLTKERRGTFAGEPFARRYGALLLPENLMRGSFLAEQSKAPLGATLIRMKEDGLIK